MDSIMAFLPLLVVVVIGLVLTFLCRNTTSSNARYNEDYSSKRFTSEFRGDTGEYVATFYKVLLLNVITLGIYSPWGTVKLKKLLLNNTYIGKNSFDFHATPLSILKGRAIIVGIFILISVLSAVNPIAYAVVLLGLFALAPIFFHLGLKFKYRNHSYAGIRFQFNGRLRDAFKITYGLLFGVLTTLTLATPVFSRFANAYVLNNTRWGDRQLGIDLKISSFYKVYGKSLLVFFLGSAVMTLIFALLSNAIDSGGLSIWHFLPLSLYLLLPIVIGVYRWSVISLVVDSLCVDKTAKGESNLNFGSILKLILTNLVVVILTLGIYYPWAKLRAHRLMMRSVSFRAVPSVAEISHHPGNETSGITDEISSTVYDLSF